MKNASAMEKDHLWVDDAAQTVDAIREGAVDAFVIEEADGQRVYTLQGADLPYSVLVERMPQPAAMITAQAEIIYCNPAFARLLGTEPEDVVGSRLKDLVDPAEHELWDTLHNQSSSSFREGELHLCRADGVLIPTTITFTPLLRDNTASGILISDKTAHYQQRELASRLLQIQDEERRRIARELHDSVGQLLAALAMNIARVAEESSRLSPEAADCVRENDGLVQEITREIRTISHLLHPPLLDEVGLPSALKWFLEGFGKRSNIQTTLEIPEGFPRLGDDVEIAIFRAVQESVTNVHRHSGSPSCKVVIACNHDQVRIEITDEGRGIPPEKLANMAISGGVGFRGMQERIRQLGGTVDISSKDRGTTVRAILPAKLPDRTADIA
ncbi:MAG TPA: ATP-binding protein [Terriglobales bacterium]|nr:ATP-binding protein [Terriglobales bacterium]